MAELYDDLDSMEEQAEEPQSEHLFAAATYLQDIFRASNIVFAIMGGYSLVLRGSDRTTNDVDIAADSTMLALYRLMSQQDRLLVPRSRLAATNVLRVFVKTGPQWDSNTTERHLVNVDILVPGEGRGVPNPVSAGMEIIVATNPTMERRFPVLSIPFMLRAKLKAYRDREGDNDFSDIIFILTRFPAVVCQPSTRAKLDGDACAFFLEQCTSDDAERFAQLLGVD